MWGQQSGYPQQQYGQQQQPFLANQATGVVPTYQMQQGMRSAPQQGSFLQSQPTGYPGQQPSAFLQPQMTSMPIQSQMTGFPAQRQQQYGAPPPMPSMPQQYQQNGLQSSLLGPARSAQMGLSPQPTSLLGFANAQHVPSMFTQTFLPANPSQPVYGSQPQFAQPSALGGQSLNQAYQQNMQQQGQTQVNVPWALSADERKSYDSIFRAWDQSGSGFINGNMAQEVFGQSGLDRDELMQVWNLADTENRGKLNLAEFHVAMGLIYRRINGNPIPSQLPPELVPPSSRDLGHSVDFLKDLLRNDTTVRNTATDFPEAAAVGNQANYTRSKSLHSGPQPPSRKDATMYKHDDTGAGTYKSSSRHIDRKAVRASGDESSSGDLDEIKRQLDTSQALLDKSKNRDAEDDALAQEKDDLLYEIKRVQSDIEHNSRGRRTEAKEAERRKLDRELDRLKYDKLPELERKLDIRAQEVAAQKRRDNRDRDSRNDRYGRYEDRSSVSSSRYDERKQESRDRSAEGSEDEADRGYLRGSYDRPSSRTNQDRESRPRSPSREQIRSAPPPPPPATKAAPPPPPPVAVKPSASTMSPEDRKEYIRAEAARRVQERLRALGISSESEPAPVVVASASSAQPAIANSASADQEAADRAKQRQLKLEKEKMKDISQQEAYNEKTEQALQQVSNEVTAAAMSTPKGGAEVADAARSQLDKDEDELRQKELALAKAKADQMARIKKMEEELEESKRLEEEFTKKKAMFNSSPQKAKGPPPPLPKSRQAVKTPALAQNQASTVPDPQPAPVAPQPPAVSDTSKGSTNPFHRPAQSAPTQASTVPASASLSKTNPFNIKNREQTASPVEKPPTPKPAFIPPAARPAEDWDMPTEHFTDSDSSDDEEPAVGARNKRQQLAANLFGGIMPSRPTSAMGNPASPQTSNTPPPAPSTAPRAPVINVPSGPVDRGSLLGQIQSGIGLKKAKTNDRSASALAGQVLGSSEPPAHIRTSPEPQNDRTLSTASESDANHRQSVDWYNGLASDSTRTPAHTSALQSYDEAEEDANAGKEESSGFLANAYNNVASTVTSAAVAVGLVSAEPDGIDHSRSTRSRTLYAYHPPSDRPDDLVVEENIILDTKAASDNEDWVYGKVESTGQAGWLPANYVASIEDSTNANALYDYSAASSEEMDLRAGQSYKIVDRSDEDWWKAESSGRCALVPASYFEVAGSQ